jgi:uncharacterized protein (DUF2141 family)
MGGPIDETNPTVISLTPTQNSINIKPEKITIEFDEYIKLENPSKNIIITPKINKDEIEITAVKNKVNIVLNQELEDNTTYVFNFQKSIEDLSEGNSAENLKLVFSTGPSIDSLSVKGNVYYAFPKNQQEYKDVLVGLYLANDSTNFFQTPRYYITQTDSAGNFQINNIKPGKYKGYAWEDANSNLKADFKSESFDFFLDTLEITQPIDSLIFNLSKGDQTPIKLIRSSPNGRQYDLVMNRNPADIKLKHPEIGKSIFYTTATDKRIKLYTAQPILDSLQIGLELKDSVGFHIDSVFYAKFQESDRKPEKLTITGNTGKSFYQKLPIELKFNKPLMQVNFDSLYIAYDTAQRIPITTEMLSFADSATRTLLKIEVPIPDDLAYELFTIKAADSTFFDIDGYFNEKQFIGNYRKLKKETLSDGISGRILRATGPFIVQLLNGKGEVAYSKTIEKTDKYQFTEIEPGTYEIRVIWDQNQNQRWDPANFKLKQYAEQVSYFEDPKTKKREITIRGGWSLEDQNIIMKPKTGLKIK